MTKHLHNFACPVCDSQAFRDLVFIGNVPVHCNLLWPERTRAVSAPTGDIDLVFCTQCGHIANRAFDASLTEYTQAYENSLHFSPRFQAFAHSLAADLVQRHDLRGRHLVEIGAGQGDFLRLLCDLGGNTGMGFDEAYVASEDDALDERLTFIAEFDWQDHIADPPDMIYARHVLEHIQHPAQFIAVIRDVVGDAEDTLLFLEVPNMAYTLRELAIWDIIYEHCGYFTPQSLSCLLTRGGFRVLKTAEVFGGQFLTIEAKPATSFSQSGCATASDLQQMSSQVAAFAGEFHAKTTSWQARIAAWRDQGKRVVAWGAGSKGVTFLNVLQVRNEIPYIVDINPRKLGMFVVGTGQEIVAPEFMREYKPDVVILMNPLYREEIGRMLADLGVSAELVAA